MADTRKMDPSQLDENDELESALADGEEDLAEEFAEEDPVPQAEEKSYTSAADDSRAALTTQAAPSVFSRIKWGRVALACIFAFMVLGAVLFVWNRWYRFDDVADFQGTWRDTTSGASMEVDASYIKLAEDAIYEYKIDPMAKTISYSFGGHEGFSNYRFSEDRQLLVLEDSAEVDWGLVFHFRDDPGFAEGGLPEGMTRLEKVSSEVPEIKPPGSNRPAGSLVQSKPQLPSSSSSSSAAAGAAGTASSDASSAESSKPKASQTEPDENGLIVGPDRNAKGYYNEEWIFVPVTKGHFDDEGNWVDSDEEGYYDESGKWTTYESTEESGYYDENGNWVAQESTQSGSAGGDSESGSGYYDQYGNWVDTSSWNTEGGATNDGSADAASGEYAGESYGETTTDQW